MGGSQEAIDDFGVGLGGGVVEEGVQLGGGWGKPGKIEGDAAEPGGFGGGGSGGDAALAEGIAPDIVEGAARAGERAERPISGGGGRRGGGGSGPRGAAAHPFGDGVDGGGWEGRAGGHFDAGVSTAENLHEEGLIGIAWGDDAEGGLGGVELEVGGGEFSGVAGVAVGGEEGADVGFEEVGGGEEGEGEEGECPAGRHAGIIQAVWWGGSGAADQARRARRARWGSWGRGSEMGGGSTSARRTGVTRLTPGMAVKGEGSPSSWMTRALATVSRA